MPLVRREWPLYAVRVHWHPFCCDLQPRRLRSRFRAKFFSGSAGMLPAVLLLRYRFNLFDGAFRASQTEAVRQHAEQSEQYARGPQIRANSVRNFFAEFLVGA